MRRYLVAYGLWLAGVLTAAGVAFLFYRRVAAIGADELERELGLRPTENGSPTGPSARRRDGSPGGAAPAGAPDLEAVAAWTLEG